MAGVATSIDLEKAARNIKYVFDSASGKKKSYLTANFEITSKETEQAAASDLVKAASKAFMSSHDPRKLAHTSKIFTQLAAMAPVSTAPALVKQMLPVLERARLKEIPAQLSMLAQAKDVIKILCCQAVNSFPVIRANRFIDEQMTVTSVDKDTGARDVIFKQIPKIAELGKILETTEGLAFAQKFPMAFIDGSHINADEFTQDDQRLLETFISSSSGLCCPYAARIYWVIEAQRAFDAYSKAMDEPTRALSESGAFMLPTLGPGSTEKNPFYNPSWLLFIEKAFPAFGVLNDFCAKTCAFKLDNPAAYEANIKMLDRCKAAVKEFSDVNARYRELFDEFRTLSLKYATEGAPPPAQPLSTLPSIHRAEGAPFVFAPLPTPDQFDAITCTLSVPDMSPSYPPIPKVKPMPRAASVSETVSTSRTESKDESKEKKAPSLQDSKEDAPRRPSLYGKRTFTFSQKDQRVLDWETNPKTPLAGESYCTLSPDGQKEQTWRHGCCILDPFVGTEYSRKGEWTNNRGERQTAYFIQAEVEWQGKKPTRCVFQYAFDKDKVLYHRYAGERSNIQIVDDLLAKNRYENDFPTLDKSFELFKTKPAAVKVDVPGEVPYTIDPFDVITVKDDKYDLVIRIFKQG